MRAWMVAASALMFLPAGWAAATKSWEISSYGAFLAGKFENVALGRDGVLRAAPPLTAVHESGQAVVWSIARAADGTIYYGTGHQGAVFTVSPSGEGRQLWQAPEIEIFALALGPDGHLYAGSSPSGKVYRVAPDGEAEVFFDPGEKYIWSLVFDASGSLVIGTGTEGKLYRVDPDGAGGVWLESGQRHVMSLAASDDGSVLAGTDPDGILFKVAADGEAFALHDADLPEVRSVIQRPDGDIIVAVMGGGMDRVLQAIPVNAQAPQVQAAVGGQPGVQSVATQTVSSISYAQPQVVYSGERSALIRIVEGQAVEKIWTSNEEHVLGIAPEGAGGSGTLFATNRDGRIYRTGRDRRLSLISQTGKSQMTALLRAEGSVLVGSAHGGTLYRLEAQPAPAGVYETAPHDTGAVSSWGRISWRGETPGQAAIEIRTRSGNTHRPGTGWSPWSEPLTASEGAAIPSPGARFLQWQATLRGAATLDSVRAHYLPQNSAPVVRSVNVVPETATESSSSGSQSSDATSSYSITVSASGASSPPTPSGQGSNPDAVRKLAIVWGAEDPDGDKLRAEVSFRGEGESEWKTVETDLPGPRFSVESDSLADGRYEFRVRVDDGLANPAERALSGERTSAVVLVDQTPPVVRALPRDETAAGGLKFSASDAASELRFAEYAVDAGPWHPVLSDDGILDAREESFTIRPGDLEPGEHLIVLRVRDRAGNTGLAKALIR